MKPRLTEGQMRQRLAQHAKDCHRGGEYWCNRCLFRWNNYQRLFATVLNRTRRTASGAKP